VLSEVVPRDAWHMSGHIKAAPTSKCLDTLLKITGKTPVSVPERYLTCFKSLITGSQPFVVPWQYAIPQNEFKIFFNNVVQETKDLFPNLPFEYYETAWIPGSRVLASLKTAAIDSESLQRHIDSLGNGAPGLESFRPKRSGFAHPVVYDRFATRTGRLTVTDGPNILVLKKTCRDILKSSYEDGHIVSLDFRALEARIVLAEAGRSSTSEDIYEEISREQFGGEISRDSVKVAVLAELYGISRNALRIKLNVTDKKLDSFIGVIKDYFRVDDLKKRLKAQVGSSGKMLNRFGRPLSVPEGQDNLLVNTYAQSSGVDVSMIGFDLILERLGQDGIRPLFVLHDAIIIDVRSDRLEDVKSCSSVNISSYDFPFLLKFEQISKH
jgi:hypothetical protein